MNALSMCLAAVAAAFVAVACGDNDSGSTPGSGGAGAAGSSASPAGSGGAGGTTDVLGPSGGASGAGPAFSPPTDPAAVNAFFQLGTYRSWPSETKDHASAGPHGGTVRVFLSPELEASFAAGNAVHPAGSMTVKEFYEDGKPSGFAYSAKVDADSAGGDGWYWYEVFTNEPTASAPFAGKGVPLCKNCHAGGGRDFVLTTYPLQLRGQLRPSRHSGAVTSTAHSASPFFSTQVCSVASVCGAPLRRGGVAAAQS